jgi:carboxynorspermidine decarboxylase
MDGTTSSSLYELRLSNEEFCKESHVYSVAYSREEIKEVSKYADKIIFNSISQLKMFNNVLKGKEIGLRVNPKVSFSRFDLADPARRCSRLGVTDKNGLSEVSPMISGVMFHFNCENDDFTNFSLNLDWIMKNYGSLLKKLEWVSLGGGIYFTKEEYPLDKFCSKLREFRKRYDVQVYLEPGETAITGSGELVTQVLDIVHNEMDIAILDASVEAHMPDLLIYSQEAKFDLNAPGKYKYMVAGRSCLAGDIFGVYGFKTKLKTGSIVRIADAGGYTMVKKNWFNGLPMPSIVVKRMDGTLERVCAFNYDDFKNSLS